MDVAGGDAAAQRDVAACAGQDARTALDREGGHCNIIIIIIIIYRQGDCASLVPWILQYYSRL